MMPVRKWDRAVRTTKQSENSVDAVVILAILRYDKSDPSKDEIVCVKQFRPPVDGYTVELPAGLVDANEDPGTAAEREFKVISVSPPSFLSPGPTNESVCLVRMKVDMTLAENVKNHKRTTAHEGLEGCEKDRGLEKLLLPRVGFLDALHNLQEKDGVKIFAAPSQLGCRLVKRNRYVVVNYLLLCKDKFVTFFSYFLQNQRKN